MLILVGIFGMVLRSAFHFHDMGLTSDSKSIIMEGMSDLQDKALLLDKRLLPSVLLHAEHVHARPTWLLHYNDTIFDCIWAAGNLTVDQKTLVFRDMTTWLATHNRTLKGQFVYDDDFLAWNVAQYGEEYHCDWP